MSSLAKTIDGDEEDIEDTSWMGTLTTLWNSVFHPFQDSTTSDTTQEGLCRSSSIDTTPPNDLEQFQAAVATLTGSSSHLSPWKQDSTSYTVIPICKQIETWDCGVACLQMILAWLRNDTTTSSFSKERQWMLDTVGTESIWTIDLFFLLHEMCRQYHVEEASYCLCSKTWGVDGEHHALGYYRKAFTKDQVRVNQLFIKAEQMGLPILCLSHLGLSQVVRLVALPNVVAIVLLDNSILRRQHCSSYAGHYVVLCGMSCEPQHVKEARRKDSTHDCKDDYCFVIKNPGRAEETSYITPFLLEKAWRAKGTDDDIIFVAKRVNS